jgi:hypothetical protein
MKSTSFLSADHRSNHASFAMPDQSQFVFVSLGLHFQKSEAGFTSSANLQMWIS